jgi:hypothetical protein
VVNTYFPATASASAGATSITLGASSGAATAIASGDLLLVIQMQDADISSSNNSNYGSGTGTGAGYTSLNSAGLFEFVKATNAVGTGGGAVTLATGLVRSYRSRAATAVNGQSTFQVVRVPQFTTATVSGTLSAAAWDGARGGIVVIDVAGALTINGTVEADGKGFRGGWGESATTGGGLNTDYITLDSSLANGTKGEGIAGTPTRMNATFNTNTPTLATTGTSLGYPDGANDNATKGRGAPGNGGGGGTDGDSNGTNDENSGGGGGGNYSAGGKGGNSWNNNLAVGGEGGAAVPVSNNRIVMGGGGAAGNTNNGTADNTRVRQVMPVPRLTAAAAAAPPAAASSSSGPNPLPAPAPSTPAAAPAITRKTTPPAAAAPAVRPYCRPSSAAIPRSMSAVATAAMPGADTATTLPTGTARVVAAAAVSLPTLRRGFF